MPGRHKNGFSLVEMLIALAVSAIIIAAAFGSYAMIARNFDFQKDMKYIAQSARAVVDMINSDIRLAGYTAVDNGAITDAVMLADSGTAACCDAISVIYDQTPTERRQVTYYTKQFTSDDTRFRLYKHICQITTPLTIAEIQAGQCSATATLLAENPIADYVEDLQFLGSRGNCAPGDVEYGCGIIQTVAPISYTYVNYPSSPNHSCTDNINDMFDGDRSTYWTCRRDTGELASMTVGNVHLLLEFAEVFRPTEITINGSLGSFSGGSFNTASGGETEGNVGSGSTQGYTGAVHPYATTFPIRGSIIPIRGGPASGPHVEGGWTCVWKDDSYCTRGDYYENFRYSPTASSMIKYKPVSATTYDLSQNVTLGHALIATASKYLTFHIPDNEQKFCTYSSADLGWQSQYGLPWNGNPNGATGKCSIVNMANDDSQVHMTVPDVTIVGEVYGGAISATEIETSILIRSPNEHGNVDRSVGSPLTLGNRTNSWSDKHLRDSFTTATVVRNLYYSSQ